MEDLRAEVLPSDDILGEMEVFVLRAWLVEEVTVLKLDFQRCKSAKPCELKTGEY